MIHGQEASWNRLYTFFLASNIEIDIKEEAFVDNDNNNNENEDEQDNDDTSLVRFEFLLFIIMSAHARYYTQSSNDLVSSVDKCFRNHIYKFKLGSKYHNLPQMDTNHPCVHRPNDFRYNCLYTRNVSVVLNNYNKFLMSVFSVYSNHNGRKNEMAIDLWFDFIKDACIIDQDSSERDILLCFCYSRMRVKDEMYNRKRVTKLTYNEFLESLVRIAMVKEFVVYSLMLKGLLDTKDKYDYPDKWWDAGFKPECLAVDRLASYGNIPKWRSSDSGDRLELLILGIRYIFEVKRNWHLNTKFSRLNSKQIKILESRDTSIDFS
jgi:hypothetical protein